MNHNYWIEAIATEFNCVNEYKYMREHYTYIEVSSKNGINVDRVFE
jgi:hypothetical protein